MEVRAAPGQERHYEEMAGKRERADPADGGTPIALEPVGRGRLHLVNVCLRERELQCGLQLLAVRCLRAQRQLVFKFVLLRFVRQDAIEHRLQEGKQWREKS